MSEELTEQYITLDEAIKLLEINEGRFFYYVKAEPIRKEPESGKRNARYSLSDTLKLKEKLKLKELAKKQPQAEKPEILIDWLSEKDVLTSLQLDYRVYGPEVFLANLAYYVERVRMHPQVALAVFDSPKREHIHAYISLLPLPEETIIEVLSGKRKETDIKNEEIENYDRKGEYTVLAESIVVDPEHKETFNMLLKHLAEFWCEQYPDRRISKIYAQAESEDGDILIQKLFLAPLEHLAPNAFVLNMKRPGASRFIRSFQSCIQKKS